MCHKQDVVKARMWRPGNVMPFPSYLTPQQKPKREPNSSQKGSHHTLINQRRRPRRPPLRRVESEGVGVTSSIRPIFMPARARARRADWAPGPGVLVPLPLKKKDISNHHHVNWVKSNIPPVARILMWSAVIPSSLQRAATSWAANIAA